MIYYETGALCGGDVWVLKLNGITRACIYSIQSGAQRVIVGLETASNPFSTVDRNIDVKYTNLYRNQTNGTDWQVLGHPSASDFIVDPAYDYAWVSDTAQNFFLPPLD
jgi:hypothetical protein